MDFEGKIILITGGSKGIGLATARRFVENGGSVMIAGRQESSVARALETFDGHVARGCVADVSTVAGCKTAVTSALDAFGKLDVLFTNAGSYDAAPIEEMSEELWDRTIDTHLKGTFFSVQAALPALRSSKGCVVTMASDAGLLGFGGGWAAYCAAKGGIVNLTRQLAIDLAPDVRVNAIAPGPVGTDHLYADLAASSYGGFEHATDAAKAVIDTLPLKRMIEPEEVADAVLFLASARSMTGAILSLDAGSTIALP